MLYKPILHLHHLFLYPFSESVNTFSFLHLHVSFHSYYMLMVFNLLWTLVLPSSSSFMAKRSMQQFTHPPLSLLLFSMSHLRSNCKCAVKLTNKIQILIFGQFQFISTNDNLKTLFSLHQMAHNIYHSNFGGPVLSSGLHRHYIHMYTHTDVYTHTQI